MADASQLQLNPYALFDPSQWQNPYSNYQSSALPVASYAGMPTNFAGQPIQMPAGMTINQTPAQPQAAPAAAVAGGGVNPNQALINAIYQGGGQSGGGFGGQGSSTSGGNGALLTQLLMGGGGGAPVASAPAAQPAAAPTNNAGLTTQEYMAMRANPGPVPTYGATVPQSASSAQPGTGVLQSFLQNWKPAQSGPGSGFQQGFSHALKGMGY